MSVQVSYRKQTVLGIILLLFFIGVIEMGARAYDFVEPYCGLKEENEIYAELDFWKKSDICESWLNLVWGFDKDSDVYMPEPNQHKKTVNINSEGFRGPEVTKLKPETTYRIFMVGGSTTASLRAFSDETTIPGFLQTIFNKSDNDNIEVINAGIPGITSIQELQLIQKKIIDFNPDLIIVYDGTNDVNYPYGYKPGKESLKNMFIDALNRYLPFWETPSITHHLITDKETNIEFDDTDINEKVSLWKNNIDDICKLGEENGFKTLIILQPILGSGNKKLTAYEEKQFEIFDHFKVIPAYQKFANELDSLEENCSRVEDFRYVFDDIEDSVFFDNAHVGVESNKIIADKIYQILLQMI